jgi:hypothetical protein
VSHNKTCNDLGLSVLTVVRDRNFAELLSRNHRGNASGDPGLFLALLF